MTDARPAEHANELSKNQQNAFLRSVLRVLIRMDAGVADRCCSAAAAAFG